MKKSYFRPHIKHMGDPAWRGGSITFMLCSLIIFFPWQVLAAGDMVRQVTDKTKYVDKYFEVDQNGKFEAHVYLGDQKLASIDNDDNYFNLGNHLGSHTIITNPTGQIVEENDYDDYGGIIHSESSINNVYKFSAKELDAENSLQYFGARYMDNEIGRFISIDPLMIDILNGDKYGKDIGIILSNPQELNSYAYAVNNPVIYTDPTGNTSIGQIWNSFVSSVSSYISSIFNKPNDINQTQISISAFNQSTVLAQSASAQKTSTWDSVSDARIKQLDSSVQQPATNFINNVELEFDVQLRVTQGYRSFEEQNSLYWQSRIEPPTGPWVTNAKGGQSYHNYGRAIDVVVMENGQPVWNPISQDVANIGIEQGFEWGGNWSAPYTDYPHFQMTGGQSWQDLYNSHNK